VPLSQGVRGDAGERERPGEAWGGGVRRGRKRWGEGGDVGEREAAAREEEKWLEWWEGGEWYTEGDEARERPALRALRALGAGRCGERRSDVPCERGSCGRPRGGWVSGRRPGRRNGSSGCGEMAPVQQAAGGGARDLGAAAVATAGRPVGVDPRNVELSRARPCQARERGRGRGRGRETETRKEKERGGGTRRVRLVRGEGRRVSI